MHYEHFAELLRQQTQLWRGDLQDGHVGLGHPRQRKDARAEAVTAAVILDDQGIGTQAVQVAIGGAARHAEMRRDFGRRPQRLVVGKQQHDVDGAVGGGVGRAKCGLGGLVRMGRSGNGFFGPGGRRTRAAPCGCGAGGRTFPGCSRVTQDSGLLAVCMGSR